MTTGAPWVTRPPRRPGIHADRKEVTVALHLHAAEPPSGRPLTVQKLYTACYRGELPAETLDTAAREHLVYDLWLKGWSDVEIATHTSMTLYTTARIRARLGLAPHRTRKEIAA